MNQRPAVCLKCQLAERRVDELNLEATRAVVDLWDAGPDWLSVEFHGIAARHALEHIAKEARAE